MDVGFGFAQVLVMALFLSPSAGAGIQPDLVSVIDPAEYFFSRRVEGGAKNMLEAATKAPTNPQGSLTQLLAIRWLGEHKARLGDSKEAVHTALQKLADGPEGSARDYAQLALARIDDKPFPVLHTIPKEGVRPGLEWFPNDVNLAGVIDVRPPAGQKSAKRDDELEKQFKRLQTQLMKMMPEEAKEEFYKFAESVGNIRVDRVASGYAPDPSDPRKGRAFVRFTGRADHKALAAFIKEKAGNDAKGDEKKGPKGEPITIISFQHPPAFALIGDTDVIMAGYTGDFVNSVGLVEQVLAVRAGSQPSVFKGPLAKALENVPAGVSGIGRGFVLQELQDEINRSPVGVSPQQVAADLFNRNTEGKGVELRVRGTFGNEADAKKFAEGIKDLIGKGIEALKNVPPFIKPEVVAAIKKTMEEIEIKTDGMDVISKTEVSMDTQQKLLDLLEAALKFQAALERR